MTDKTIFGDMSEEEIRAEAGMGAAKYLLTLCNCVLQTTIKIKITMIKSPCRSYNVG